jgi:hypothetical protein
MGYEAGKPINDMTEVEDEMALKGSLRRRCHLLTKNLVIKQEGRYAAVGKEALQ